MDSGRRPCLDSSLTNSATKEVTLVNYKVLIAALLIATIARADDLDPIPPGWVASGPTEPSTPGGHCAMGVDGAMAGAGQANLSIKCTRNDRLPEPIERFVSGSDEFEPSPDFPDQVLRAPVPSGMLRQNFEAVGFYGKRVRFSAWLKAEGIPEHNDMEGGGLFISLPYDAAPLVSRIEERKISGWTDWEYREIVVDVPAHGPWIAVGFRLRGEGQIWMKDLEFEVVPDSVPVDPTATNNDPANPNSN